MASSQALSGKPGVEIELASEKVFPGRNALVLLRTGDECFSLGAYSTGDPHTLVFALGPRRHEATATFINPSVSPLRNPHTNSTLHAMGEPPFPTGTGTGLARGPFCT